MAQSASYEAHLSAALTTALLAAAVGLGSHTALATPSCNDSDPYLICNVQDLQNVNNDLVGSYLLGQDLDASGFNFTPIGRVGYNAFLPFTGSLNGNGHTINHLSISSQSDLFVGMFVYVDEVGRVENLTLSDVAIQGTSSQGAVVGSIAAESHGSIIESSTTGTVSGGAGSAVGGLVGYQGYPGRVVQSSSSATVIGGKNNIVGGLVGQNFGDIVASYATGDVYAERDSWVGGLVGYHSDASISRSYSTANVQGGLDSYIGGLVGWNVINANIDRSYALGSVTGSNSSYIGGLVGENGGVCPACAPAVIDQSYSAGPVADPLGQHVGGLVGLNYPPGSVFNQGIVTNSYWDTQTSRQSTSDGGNPKTTADLKSGTLPTGFDSAVWTAQPGKYPELIGLPPPPPGATPIALLDLVRFAKAAYGDPLIVPGYHEVPLASLSLPPLPSAPGFSARVFIDGSGSSVVLAIGGSDDLQDWIGPNPSFISPFGPTQALKDYSINAGAILNALKGIYPSASITLTGHSLGGAIAQILANATGLGATTFDAPGVRGVISGIDLSAHLSQFLTPPAVPLPLINYRIYGDLVSTVGTPLDSLITITYEPPPGISKLLIDKLPLSTAKPLHDLLYMQEQVFDNAPTTADIGPIADAQLIITLPIAGVTVTGGLIYGLDPQGPDGYWLAEDPASPRFRSVIFPLLTDPNAGFRLETFAGGAWGSLGVFDDLTSYDFGPLGVDQFRLFVLDSTDLTPFLSVEPFTLGLTFVNDGILNADLVEFSSLGVGSVPEPSSIALVGASLGCFLLVLFVVTHRCNPNGDHGYNACCGFLDK